MKKSARNLLLATCAVAAACSKEHKPRRASAGSHDAAPSAAPIESSSRSRALDEYVGLRYNPLPKGVTYLSGAVIVGADGTPSRFVISRVATPNGPMIWLDEMLPDEGTTRRRVVRATMHEPEHARDQQLVVGTCEVGGKLAGDVFALAQTTPRGEKTASATHAWRANTKAARFDTIAPVNVVCSEPDN